MTRPGAPRHAARHLRQGVPLSGLVLAAATATRPAPLDRSARAPRLAPLWTLRSATWYVTCYTLWLGLLRVVAAEDLGEKRHVPRRLRRSTACGSWRKDAGSAGAGSRARSECARPAPARAPTRATRGPRQSSRAARGARARRGMRRGPRGGGRCVSRRTYPYCPISPLVHQ